MFTTRWIGVLYFLMALVIVLPGAFYLARRISLQTKLIWIAIWLCVFLACLILYRYASPFIADGLR